MRVAHIIRIDPALADISVLERIEFELAGLDIGPHVLDLLLLRIVHFENDVAVIQRHVEIHAMAFDEVGDALDPAEMLRPHVHVHFEARHDAPFLSDFARPEIGFRDLAIGHGTSLKIVRENLHVLDARSVFARDLQMPLQQRLVAAEHVKPTAGSERQTVFLDCSAELRRVVRRRRLVIIIEDTRVLHHAEACIEIELVPHGVHDTGFLDADEQLFRHQPSVSLNGRGISRACGLPAG